MNHIKTCLRFPIAVSFAIWLKVAGMRVLLISVLNRSWSVNINLITMNSWNCSRDRTRCDSTHHHHCRVAGLGRYTSHHGTNAINNRGLCIMLASSTFAPLSQPPPPSLWARHMRRCIKHWDSVPHCGISLHWYSKSVWCIFAEQRLVRHMLLVLSRDGASEAPTFHYHQGNRQLISEYVMWCSWKRFLCCNVSRWCSQTTKWPNVWTLYFSQLEHWCCNLHGEQPLDLMSQTLKVNLSA